jgi:hypothetical protein
MREFQRDSEVVSRALKNRLRVNFKDCHTSSRVRALG